FVRHARSPGGNGRLPLRLATLVKTALDETRMLVLGAQVLLGFEFSGVFRDGFERLPLHARYLDGIALLLLIVTVALLITPETYHHLVETGRHTGRFHQLISRMADCALLPIRAQSRLCPLHRWRKHFRFLDRSGSRR